MPSCSPSLAGSAWACLSERPVPRRLVDSIPIQLRNRAPRSCFTAARQPVVHLCSPSDTVHATPVERRPGITAGSASTRHLTAFPDSSCPVVASTESANGRSRQVQTSCRQGATEQQSAAFHDSLWSQMQYDVPPLAFASIIPANKRKV